MRVISALSAIVAVIALGAAVQAQKITLRSQLTPNCTSSVNRANFADLFAEGNVAVLGTYGCKGAFIFDISNPESPVLASWYNPSPNQQFLEAIVVNGRGYFGSGTGGGVHIVDLHDPYHPVLLGTVDSSHGGGHNLIHEMMVVPQGKSTYLIENYNSTAMLPVKIIDVTNPASPVFRSQFTSASGGWIHAMHIRGNRMYTSEYTGSNVEIYDISNLGSGTPPVKLGTIASNTTNHSSWTSEDGKYLYSCRETYDGDLRIYDVQDPAHPFLVRSYKTSELNLNAICPHNPVVMGNKLYISWYQAGLQVFDISNPVDPKPIAQYDTYPINFAPTDEQIASSNDRGQPWDTYCGANLQSAVLPSSYDGNWAVYPFLGTDKIVVGDLVNGLILLDASHVDEIAKNRVSDFDGDKKTDLAYYSPANGVWTYEGSGTSSQSQVQFGLAGDIIQSGDFDGDGKTDQAVFRPSNGTWYLNRSSAGFGAVQFGMSSDVPVVGDFDADGKTDIAVWRPSNGVWYIQQSTLGFKALQWGTNGDSVMTGDYDHDGKSDLVAWRPSNGVWYVLQSTTTTPLFTQFGQAGDKPVFADFDGNGATDYAVYRPSTGAWFTLDPVTRNFKAYNFGISEDIPVPADYDGDGRSDIAVYRPSQGTWYMINSSDNSFYARAYGQAGDRPVPSSVNP